MDVKICGLTRYEDAAAALDYGADYLGFIFYERSPRYVPPEVVKQVVAKLPKASQTVGVFVNKKADDVRAIVELCGLSITQLHGGETYGDFSEWSTPIWRVLAFDAASRAWQPDPAGWAASRYVVDAAVPGQYGGTGVKADWEQAGLLAKSIPVMLAGGLTPENVVAAIDKVKPVGVDVASGVEQSKGIKDHHAVRGFIDAVRQNDL